jgi:hypothetical protein
MIYKYTSVKRVIAKVFTDFDLQEGDHRLSDMVEWVGEALEQINAFPQYRIKVTGKDNEPLLEVNNFQAKLPFDFHRLIQVTYSTAEEGPFYAMRTSTGTMEYASEINTEIESNSTDDVVKDADLLVLAMDLYDLTYSAALSKINSEPSTKAKLTALLNTGSNASGGTSQTIDYIYSIQDNWIKTNQRDGYIMLSYQAIPVDSEGYPMVPDSISFLEALYWYIAVKLLYPMWRDGRVRDAVYYDARSNWNYYSKQAYGNAMMPDTDTLESIKNQWLRLIPEINEHKSMFSTLGQEQRIYNHNR